MTMSSRTGAVVASAVLASTAARISLYRSTVVESATTV
jgi:hypothetical protein